MCYRAMCCFSGRHERGRGRQEAWVLVKVAWAECAYCSSSRMGGVALVHLLLPALGALLCLSAPALARLVGSWM